MTIKIFASNKAPHYTKWLVNCKIAFYKYYKNIMLYLLINILIMILNNKFFVKSLPENFHISLSQNSKFSKSFEKIKPLYYKYGDVISNMTIYAKTINKEDSATFKIEKSNAEISTSVSNLYNINNEDFFFSKNDYLIDYIYSSSTILSQFPDQQINSTNSDKIIKCNYFVNSPNLSYNWVNIKSYKATAKYSFFTFVLKQDVNGVFYLDYKAENNELVEVNVNSINYDLNSEKYVNIWFIEQKFIDNDYLVLAKEKGNDFELIVLTVKIDDSMQEYFYISLNFFTKIQIKANLYRQINKIGYFKDQFILATRKTGLVILHRFQTQVPSDSNNTFLNITNFDNNLLNNDPVWTSKTTINNFKDLKRNNYSIFINKEENFDLQNENKLSNRNQRQKRYLQSNSTINSSLNINITLNNTETKSSNSNVSTNVTSNNNLNGQNAENITLININVLDMTINEFTIYLIVEKRGLFIINLENFQISEDFIYENPHLYKLEFFNNIFLGNKFIGVYAQNPDSSSQELYVELLIDQELNPSANKVFTSQIYTGQGKANSYDDFFTIILNTKEKKLILIRKGMLNPMSFTTHILDISNYVKFGLENTEFVSLYDSSNKKAYYSLYTVDLIIPLNITFADEFINCKFSQSGKYEMNFFQRSELCRESINSNDAVSFCKINIKYSIEVVGPPSSDVQQILTGVLITFSIILIILIIFFVIKTDGCRNIKYFKIIKTAQIRERLYYDAGQEINIEGNKQREILSQRIIMNNQSMMKKDNEINKYKDPKKEYISVIPTARSFRYVFNLEIKKIEPNLEIKSSINDNNVQEELKIEDKASQYFKDSKRSLGENIINENENNNIIDFKESIKEKLKTQRVIQDEIEGFQIKKENNLELNSNQFPESS